MSFLRSLVISELFSTWIRKVLSVGLTIGFLKKPICVGPWKVPLNADSIKIKPLSCCISRTKDVELQQNLFLKLWQPLSEITEVFSVKLAEISLEEIYFKRYLLLEVDLFWWIAASGLDWFQLAKTLSSSFKFYISVEQCWCKSVQKWCHAM